MQILFCLFKNLFLLYMITNDVRGSNEEGDDLEQARCLTNKPSQTTVNDNEENDNLLIQKNSNDQPKTSFNQDEDYEQILQKLKDKVLFKRFWDSVIGPYCYQEHPIIPVLAEKIFSYQDFYSLLSKLLSDRDNFDQYLTKKKYLIQNESYSAKITLKTYRYMHNEIKNNGKYNENYKNDKEKLTKELSVAEKSIKKSFYKIYRRLLNYSETEIENSYESEICKITIFNTFDLYEKMYHAPNRGNKNLITYEIEKNSKRTSLYDLNNDKNNEGEDIEKHLIKILANALKIHLLKDEINELEEYIIEKPIYNLELCLNYDHFDKFCFKLRLEIYKHYVAKTIKRNDYNYSEIKKLKLNLNNRNKMLTKLFCFNNLLDTYLNKIDPNSDKYGINTLLEFYEKYKKFGKENFEKIKKDIILLNKMIIELQSENDLLRENILKMVSDFKKLYKNDENEIEKKEVEEKEVEKPETRNWAKKIKKQVCNRFKPDQICFEPIFDTKFIQTINTIKISQLEGNLPEIIRILMKIYELNFEMTNLDTKKDKNQIRIKQEEIRAFYNEIDNLIVKLDSDWSKSLLYNGTDQKNTDDNNESSYLPSNLELNEKGDITEKDLIQIKPHKNQTLDYYKNKYLTSDYTLNSATAHQLSEEDKLNAERKEPKKIHV
ncbi:hypothetical protein GVAV_002234 [Gurleya vavrai]